MTLDFPFIIKLTEYIPVEVTSLSIKISVILFTWETAEAIADTKYQVPNNPCFIWFQVISSSSKILKPSG